MTQITKFPFEGIREEVDLETLQNRRINIHESITLPLRSSSVQLALVALCQGSDANRLWFPLYRVATDRIAPADYYAPSNLEIIDRDLSGKYPYSLGLKEYLLAIRQLVGEGPDIMNTNVVLPQEQIFLGFQPYAITSARAFYRIPVVTSNNPEHRIGTSLVVEDRR